MARKCKEITHAGTRCKRPPRKGKNYCGLHDASVDIDYPERGGVRAGDIWARLKRAEKRYPLKTWEETIAWLNGEIVLAREALEDTRLKGERDDGVSMADKALAATSVARGTDTVQKWGRMLLEALRHYDEKESGKVEVVFNLEYRPPEGQGNN